MSTKKEEPISLEIASTNLALSLALKEEGLDLACISLKFIEYRPIGYGWVLNYKNVLINVFLGRSFHEAKKTIEGDTFQRILKKIKQVPWWDGNLKGEVT